MQLWLLHIRLIQFAIAKNIDILPSSVACVGDRAGKSKRRENAEKGGKGEFDLQSDFWQNSTSSVEMS